jgi:hypothetical protein
MVAAMNHETVTAQLQNRSSFPVLHLLSRCGLFVMKILKTSDDRADKWKLSLESKIFIALVRSL